MEFSKEIESAINNFFFVHIFNINNHNSRGTSDIESRNISEIFVKGKQDVVVSNAVIENYVIRGADKLRVVDRDNFKPLASQSSNDILVNALVGKDDHKRSLNLGDCLGGMLHKLRSVFNRGNNIFLGDTRILLGNFL